MTSGLSEGSLPRHVMYRVTWAATPQRQESSRRHHVRHRKPCTSETFQLPLIKVPTLSIRTGGYFFFVPMLTRRRGSDRTAHGPGACIYAWRGESDSEMTKSNLVRQNSIIEYRPSATDLVSSTLVAFDPRRRLADGTMPSSRSQQPFFPEG